MKCLVASFGFDIDFVLRRLTIGKYNRVVLVALKTSEGFERVKKAYSTLSLVCNSLRIECILEPISPSTLFRSVYSILQYEASRASELEIYLTSGPRILVTTLLLSALMLPKDYAMKIKTIVEGEGFDCTVNIDVYKLLERLCLDERDKAIISVIEGRKLTLSEIVKETGIPKSTVHRRLEELITRGLVVKTETETYIAKPTIEVTYTE